MYGSCTENEAGITTLKFTNGSMHEPLPVTEDELSRLNQIFVGSFELVQPRRADDVQSDIILKSQVAVEPTDALLHLILQVCNVAFGASHLCFEYPDEDEFVFELDGSKWILSTYNGCVRYHGPDDQFGYRPE